MSRDIESVLRDAVRDLASQARPAYGLAAAAIRRQRRIRLRRRIGGSLAALVAAAVIATPYVVLRASATTALTPSPSASPSATPSRYPRSTGPTTLPEASGVPGAADRSELVGTDPGVLHFDVQLSVLPGLTIAGWSTRPGLETMTASYNGKRFTPLSVYLSPDERRLDEEGPAGAEKRRQEMIAQHPELGNAIEPAVEADLRQETSVLGRPATLERYPGREHWTPPGEPAQPDDPPTWTLRWQPVDGLWALVIVEDETDVVLRKVAETLRLDRAQYCAQPLVATTLPSGTRLYSCSTNIRFDDYGQYAGLGKWWYSGFEVVNAGGGTLMARLEPKPPTRSMGGPKDVFRPNRTVGRYPAMWTVQGRGYGELRIDDYEGKFDLRLAIDTRTSGFTEAEVLAMAEGLRVVGDLNDPATWPTRPVE
jgi:hypothetical protein